MRRRIRALFRSLEIRLLLPLSITAAVILAVHAVLSFRSTHEQLVLFVGRDVERSSGLIRGATHDGMLLNRLDEVQSTIERLAEDPEVAAIRVYDKDGGIVLSSRKEEIGLAIALDAPTCRSCHDDGRGPRDSGTLQRQALHPIPEGSDVVRHLTVIENEPQCATAACHAHPSNQRVLGVLEVAMSMVPFDAAAATAQKQLVWTTAALILISGGIAAIFIRRVVHRRVHLLYQGTQRIGTGDLDTRIEVRGSDELAHLADAFNGMVEDLRSARNEVTTWSQNLEEKVVEKTEELRRAQRQVLHMEKMASLGQLSATVAHELNNPMSGVLTYARLVQRELDEQPLEPDVHATVRRYLSLVEKECSRCGEIVRNLLTFARRTGSEMTPVDLNEVTERSLMLVRHHLEISDVRLVSELLEGDPVLVADAGQLQQALVALLINAAEAMSPEKDGEAVLSVRLRGDDEILHIEITDTGVGIAPEDVPFVFEPFFSTKEMESGVGLGLAVVYGIVNRHGGSIDVDSVPGCGTTMRIRLPRRGPSVKADDVAIPETIATGGTSHGM